MKLYKISYENFDHHVIAIWTTSQEKARAAVRHLEMGHEPDMDEPIRVEPIDVPTTSGELCQFLNEHASAVNEGEQV